MENSGVEMKHEHVSIATRATCTAKLNDWNHHHDMYISFQEFEYEGQKHPGFF
jgi:hypothetical protein